MNKEKDYDALVAKLKEWHDALQDGSNAKTTLEVILPQFRETKEDKARKGLIALVDWAKHLVASGMTTDDVKLYLEFLNKKEENQLEVSEEELDELRDCADQNNVQGRILTGLYNKLKKYKK